MKQWNNTKADTTVFHKVFCFSNLKYLKKKLIVTLSIFIQSSPLWGDTVKTNKQIQSS